MRKYHRWVSISLSLLIVFVAATGITMQLEFWLTGRSPPGSEKVGPAPPVPLPSDEELVRAATRVAAVARAQAPRLSAERMELRFVGGKMVGTVGALVPIGPHIDVDIETGKMIPAVEKTNWHSVIQDIHAGYSFGIVGRILSCLVGLGLIVLSITGLSVYLDMFRRRRKAGKKNAFWS